MRRSASQGTNAPKYRRRLRRRRSHPTRCLGTLDLVAAVVLGIASANGTPIQLIHAGAGSAAMAGLPWSLVPTFLVPIYLIGHGIVFAQARAAALGAD